MEDLKWVANLREDPSHHLFQLMILNETHMIVFGAIGTGKSSLMRNALVNIPSDYSVIVFDVVGNYEGYTDYYAPYPFNPLDYLSGLELTDIIREVLSIRFPRLQYIMTPAMDELLMRAYSWFEEPVKGIDSGAYPKNIEGLIKVLRDAIKVGIINTEDEVNSTRGLLRRLEYFRHWIFNETHPLIAKLLSGGLRGLSVGIDLHFLTSPLQRWFYVLSFIASLDSAGTTNIILIIDEAHLYFRTGESTLTFAIRTGRNRRRYFVLITQSPLDIPNELISSNKLFVEFPIAYSEPREMLFHEKPWLRRFGREAYYQGGAGVVAPPDIPWRESFTALMHAHLTRPELVDAFGGTFVELPIRVNVNEEPKITAITLKACCKALGVDPSIIYEFGFRADNVNLNEKLREVWQCIGDGYEEGPHTTY
ncbi:ATP-binding protein [Vulcanisaeta thermophila]|uniref:ATP-binding protein n=1 Tax=Vulcanisaeta thermophila TaxID=867917 RepID=UPI000A3FEAC1|nr:ATP-binding protein [Vulcanisaeta thermophila]